MWTFGLRRKTNIYWYVKGRVVVPQMSLVVLVNFEMGCWKIYRHVPNSVCLLANNKNQKLTRGANIYLQSLIKLKHSGCFFFSPSHHSPYMGVQFPTVAPVTLAKVLDEKTTGRKRKMGTKRWKLFSDLEEQRGSVLWFSGKKKGFKSGELVSSYLTILCALWASICITNIFDIIACVVWFLDG